MEYRAIARFKLDGQAINPGDMVEVPHDQAGRLIKNQLIIETATVDAPENAALQRRKKHAKD